MINIIRKWNIDFIPTLLFVFAAVMWRTQYSQLCLYVAIPAMIVYTFGFYKKSVFQCKYLKSYTIILALIVLSSMINGGGARVISMLVPIVATYLISLTLYGLTQNGNNTKMLCIAFMGLYVSIMYATLTGEAFVADFDYDNEAERRGNTILNANQYAYFSLFAIMATRILLGYKDKLWAIAKLGIYFILVIAACYTALMTASRQVLLLEIPLIAYYFYHDFLKEGKGTYKTLFIVAVIVIILYGAPLFFQYYDNSYLSVRSEAAVNEDARSSLLISAILIGLENPLFGVGLDANISFSHCTYTHLFSRCGAICVFMYIYMIINAILVQRKRFKYTRDSYYQVISVCLIFFAIANLFYSYIDQPYMLPILFLTIGEADKHTKEIYPAIK